jgi:hypothetical protein
MKPKYGRFMRFGMAGALLLILLLLAGCAEVQVVEPVPSGTPSLFVSPLSSGEGDHNLAVMAAVLDPPLQYQQLILRRQSVTLLVAIENRGASTERNVAVHATLTSPRDAELSLSQEASVASIAPGEIQIVRFARLQEIPYYSAYRLEVSVDPVAGELDLSDNGKVYDVRISRE